MPPIVPSHRGQSNEKAGISDQKYHAAQGVKMAALAEGKH